MILIFGLGNHPKKYRKTRHNVGSRTIDELESLNLEDVVLAKPTTFMNESGRAVKNLLRTRHLKPESLIVVHDDIDIPIGEIRIVKNRGAAGHKGVESIIKDLRTKNFIRFRVGVCPKAGKPKNPERFVLKNFHKEEEEVIKRMIKKTAEAIEFFLKEGLEKTMSKFNK